MTTTHEAAGHSHGGATRLTDPPAPAARTGAVLPLVALAGLVVSLTQSLLVPVLPQLAADLHAGGTSVEWLLTSTLLVGAVAMPIEGRLADLYGKKLMLLVALVALVAGSLVCALGHDLTVLIIGRAITGLAVGAVPLGISLVGSTLPPERSGSAIALISATLGVGGALGLPFAGLVAEHADYHWLFWVLVIAGGLCFIGLAVAIREPARSASGRMDYAGAVLLAAALVALLLPLAQAATWGWGDARTIGLLVAAAVLLLVFVLVERRSRSPLIDVVVNARPALLLTNTASLCVGFALFASLIGTSSYVQAPKATGYGFGSSVLTSGLCLLPSGLAMLVLSPVSAALTRRFGPKITLALGALIIAVGFALRMVLVDDLWQVIVGTSVAGAGTGIAYAAMPSLILRSAPRTELAAANGLNALCRSTGSSLASAIGGTVLAASTVALGSALLPSLTAYRILFAICAGAAVLGAVVSLTIPRRADEAPEAGHGAAQPAGATA